MTVLETLLTCTLCSRYYYQFDKDRLSICTLTAHGMLHIPDDILFCGPSWTTWTFWMERYCGVLQAGLRSKRLPWANLSKTILHHAYLEQLGVRYDLEAELSSGKTTKGAISSSEYVYDGCAYSFFIAVTYLLIHLLKTLKQFCGSLTTGLTFPLTMFGSRLQPIFLLLLVKPVKLYLHCSPRRCQASGNFALWMGIPFGLHQLVETDQHRNATCPSFGLVLFDEPDSDLTFREV